VTEVLAVSKAKLALALGILSFLNGWAVPLVGAAHIFSSQPAQTVTRSPRPIRFRDEGPAGLIVSAWIKGTGPFAFAIDTGADVSIVSSRVAQSAGLAVTKSKRPIVAGLSNAPIPSNQEAVANELSLGTRDNFIPERPVVAIVPSLPGGIDGILNPADLFGSLAFSIDLSNRQLLVFDSKTNGLDLKRQPPEGAVVPWIRVEGSHRPFVRLGDGRLALIDTGSGFGLAVRDASGNGRNHSRRTSDLGGGSVQSRELRPTTISIGSLVLENIPTQVLVGAHSSTPVILGRQALHPFKITFDPVARLIAIEPVAGR
jgi:hypothetical protein